jgi:hypothetical protein
MNWKLLPFLLLFSFFLQAQETNYSLTVLNKTYQPLSNPVSLDEGVPWDDPDFTIPLGFSFQLFNETYSTLYTFSGTGGLVSGQGPADVQPSPMIIAYGSDLIDRGLEDGEVQSPVGYQLTGSAPNRILKIQWENAGFFEEIDNGGSGSFVNFQLWLYETSNLIEIHFGDSEILTPGIHAGGLEAPLIGLNESFNHVLLETGTVYYLQGSASDPVIAVNDSGDIFWAPTATLNSHPAANTVYQFVPDVMMATEEPLIAAEWSLFPNPASTECILEVNLMEMKKEVMVRLISQLGQEVYQTRISGQQQDPLQIPLADLPNGTYVVQLIGDGFQSSKLLQKNGVY